MVVRNHMIPPFIYLCQWTIHVPDSTDKRTKITRIKSKHKVLHLTESNTGHVSRTYLFGQIFLRFSKGIMWNPSDQSNEGGIILEQLVSPMFLTIPCTRMCKVNTKQDLSWNLRLMYLTESLTHLGLVRTTFKIDSDTHKNKKEKREGEGTIVKVN